MRLPLAIVLAATAACGRDVVLGAEEPPDAGLAVLSGSYALEYGALLDVPRCVGEYAGQEDTFATLDGEAAGLAGGEVVLDLAGAGLRLSGAPIALGFQRDALALAHDVIDGQPRDALLGIAAIDRAGLEGTRALVGILSLSTVGATARHMAGWASVCYAPEPDETDRHGCTLTFAVTLDACCSTEP